MSVRDLTALRVLPTQVTPKSASDRASVEIYRPFFLAGIVSVLTVGCMLGAIALFGIGRSATYTSPDWMPYILAHANSQLYGWVGFFVMGFSLQQHAPSLGRKKLFHQLAYASLGLMAVGIALRFVAEPMVRVNRELWVPVGVFSGVLQFAAVGTFIFNTGYTRHRSGAGLSWQSRFVFASLFWLLAVSLAEPFAFANAHQADAVTSVMFVGKWYPALRDAQFLGFVAMMIFGVSLVKLNSCFGACEVDGQLGRAGFSLWTIGLVMRMFGWVYAFDHGFEGSTQVAYFAGGFILAFAALLVVKATGIFAPLSEPMRSHKFVRGAFAWLLISGLMLLLEPIHLQLMHAPFSHAFTGAVRHALTVGFISQMILGFGAHVIARMNDLDEKSLAPLWSVFILLNIGNAGRVALEVATDYTPTVYRVMGITGFIELTALLIWAYHVSKPMFASMRRKVPHA